MNSRARIKSNAKLQGSLAPNPKPIVRTYRTDILINEQLRYLHAIEYELALRRLQSNYARYKQIQASTEKELVNEFDFSNSSTPTDLSNERGIEIMNEEESVPIQERSDHALLKSYRRNLIRCEVIDKLNKELNYARNALIKAMKVQKNQNQIRDRVEWLENEIETTLLSNNNIKYPLRRNLENDRTSLQIPKIDYKNSIVQINRRERLELEMKAAIESQKQIEILKLSQKMDEQRSESELQFRWEKKSTGSTNSLLDSSESDVEEDVVSIVSKGSATPDKLTQAEYKEDYENNNEQETAEATEPINAEALKSSTDARTSKEPISKESTFSKEASSDASPVTESKSLKASMKNIGETEDKIEEEVEAIKPTSSRASFNGSMTESTHFIQNAVKNIDPLQLTGRTDADKPGSALGNHETDRISQLLSESSSRREKFESPRLPDTARAKDSTPFWRLPHRRYEFPEYSRDIVALNPSSYHRLIIAIQDAGLEKENELSVELPRSIRRKEKLDSEDVEFIKLTKSIQSVYKKICKSAEQSTKPPERALEFKKPDESEKNQEESEAEAPTRSSRSTSHARQKQNFASQLKNSRINSVYHPPVLLPVPSLPLSRTHKEMVYPRNPKIYTSDVTPSPALCPPRIVNQHNLKEQTKLKLYKPPKVVIETPRGYNFDESKIKVEDYYDKAPSTIPWSELKPDSSPFLHSGLRFEKIRTLLSVNLKSEVFDEKRDAIKHLGLLKVGDNAIIYTLNQLLTDPTEHEVMKFECAKSLILLGDWNENVCIFLTKYLRDSSSNLKLDIIKTMSNGKNAQFVDKSNPATIALIKSLEELVATRDEHLAFDACICLGKLRSLRSLKAVDYLTNVIEESSDWNRKSIALEILVRQFGLNSRNVLLYILNQIEYSTIWMSRLAAFRLFSFLGPAVVCRSDLIDTIYKMLEKYLADDPMREVRLAVAEAIRDLQLLEKVSIRMTKNLDSPDINTRARGVIAMEMLGVKNAQTIQKLTDMLELDTSEHVRILLVKALYHLAPTNRSVIHAFGNLEKTSSIYQTYLNLRDQAKMKEAL